MNLLLSLIFKAAYAISYVLTQLVITISFQIMGFALKGGVALFKGLAARRRTREQAARAKSETASERPRAAPEDTAPRPSPQPKPRTSATPVSESFSKIRKADVEDAIVLDDLPSTVGRAPDLETAPQSESLPEPRFQLPRGDGAVYASDGFSLWKVEPIAHATG